VNRREFVTGFGVSVKRNFARRANLSHPDGQSLAVAVRWVTPLQIARCG
jgi:hypothetical protein